jgi:hypothetical protein
MKHHPDNPSLKRNYQEVPSQGQISKTNTHQDIPYQEHTMGYQHAARCVMARQQGRNGNPKEENREHHALVEYAKFPLHGKGSHWRI